MSIPTSTTPVIYPESDGLPMADNTLQFRWIQVLSANLDALFKDRDDVFVGGNLFWYPVEGFPKIVQAPDVFVVLGRPPGYRGSYKQWEEENVPMTVVFEIRSPGDDDQLMESKLRFYNEYGVEEYYHFDPNRGRLEPYLRRGGDLGPMRLRKGQFTSPRLQIHFDLTGAEMAVSYPDGTPFSTVAELAQLREEEARLRHDAETRARAEAERANQADQRANQADQRANQADQRASQADQRASQAAQRASDAEWVANRLRELTRKVTRGHASPEDLAELERLLEE